MLSTQFARWSGLAAILGGLVWIGAQTTLARRPPGMQYGPYRDDSGLAPFVIAAMLLLAVAMIGVSLRLAGRGGRMGLVGALLGIGGAATLLLGMAVGAVNDDFPAMPLILIPGMFALVGGSVLCCIVVWRGHILPRPVVALLIIGLLTLLLFNTEDARAWFALPFGFAWVVLGGVQLAMKQEHPR